MNFKKITSILLAVTIFLATLSVGASGIGSGYANIKEQFSNSEDVFQDGIGPKINRYTIDYKYYSPVGENDKTKYPLVIWLHGLTDGLTPGKQLETSDIGAWATPELQQRFKGTKGAFILAMRSPEEKTLCWNDKLIYPLRAAIDDFIAKNIDNIDISRIYLGGYSMGGRMTFKMAVAYPEMFAAIFPTCPAWAPNKDATEKIADIPVWLTSGKTDPLVNYYSMVLTSWDNIISQSNVPEKCRFSTLSKVRFPDGKRTSLAHLSWYSVNYDMFSSEDGDYPYMSTIDGNGNTVTLTYPDGMISWLSQFTSDYDGSPATDSGNKEATNDSEILNLFASVVNFIKNYSEYLIQKLK